MWRTWLTASYTDMFRAVLIWSHSHHAFLWFLSLDLGPIMMKVRLIANHLISTRLSMKATLHEAKLCCYLDCRQLLYNFHKRHRSHNVSDIQVFVSCRSECKSSSQYTRCITGFIVRRCFAEKSNIYRYIIDKKGKQINKQKREKI